MTHIQYHITKSREVNDILDVAGRRFAWWVEPDEDCDPPWLCEDGHGPVSVWTCRDKFPGELVLASDRHSHRFYDFATAVKLAKADGWDAPPYGVGTPSQRAYRAALADFRRLRGWCDGDWWYVGVCVREVDDEGMGVGPVKSLWGIESDAGDYLRETAEELASGV